MLALPVRKCNPKESSFILEKKKKSIKSLGINLIRNVRDLYEDKCKTLLKALKYSR